MTHILIVDDESDVELLFNQKFRKELRNGDYKFDFAFNGEQALFFLRSLKPLDVAFVLTDINMPGMNGLELLGILKHDFPQLKVMVISAYGDAQNVEKTMTLGADDFLTKPVNFDLLKLKLSKNPSSPSSLN
jgi:two-component system, response regulator, stage 0 sporulation protein F